MTLSTYIEHFEDNSARGYGLYLKGPGAARYTADIALQLTARGLSVIHKTSSDMFADIRKAYERGTDGDIELRKEYEQTDLLILDDLGAEQATEWTERQLYAIICGRYEAQRPVIISTAHDYADLTKALCAESTDASMAKAIVNRLRDAAFKVEAA